MGEKNLANQAQKFFKEADTNGDGLISMEEFMAYHENNKHNKHQQMLMDMTSFHGIKRALRDFQKRMEKYADSEDALMDELSLSMASNKIGSNDEMCHHQ